jgi:hypothetical protein
LAIGEQSSPFVNTLWAVATTAHQLPVFVTVTLPLVTETDRIHAQQQNGKKKDREKFRML